MENAAHNRLGRRIRRRIPFGLSGVFTAAWLVLTELVTLLSLLIWLQPSGTDSGIGAVLRWAWALSILPKVLFGTLGWLVTRDNRIRPKKDDAFYWWPLQAVCMLIAVVALLLQSVELAVALIFVPSGVLKGIGAARTRGWSEAIEAVANVATATAFAFRDPFYVVSSAIIGDIVGWHRSLKKRSGAFLRRRLRDALKGKLSRIEYGATALESCPVGGG